MASTAGAGPAIRPIRDDERGELARQVREHWGSPIVTSRGIPHEASTLPCLVAVDGERWLGVAVYRLEDGECELVLLEAFERRAGIGTALLEATAGLARRSNSRRLWLVTTNDNLDALRFYQRRGMRLARLWVDATTEARKTLKPEIPLIGEYGIPLRDELELEMILRDDDDTLEHRTDHRGEA
jgi:GNAT superfamily N-acetyltransferase